MVIHIVAESGKILPPGATGEVWVAGPGLAAGYLNRPDLTADVFVDFNGIRCYRTGDLGRWLRSGELEILGRRDSQVKLRGQRVELGEIEYRLASYPGVKHSVVIVETRPDHTQALRSFVTIDAETATPTHTEWVRHLSETLPSFMIPQSINRISSIPLNAAGKVDRQELLNSIETIPSSSLADVIDKKQLFTANRATKRYRKRE